MMAVGPVTHNDPGGYFEAKSKDSVPNYQAQIVETVVGLIKQRANLKLIEQTN